MNILIITQWFDPEPNNMKALSFAKMLRDKGNNVQVLTGFPNYPTGKIYEGYKLKQYQKEVIDGIIIHRVYLYPSHDKNKYKRMANYFSFGLSAAINGKRKIKGSIDIVYVYHPPITSTIAAFSIAKKKKAKVVLDVNDLWPDSISATGMMFNVKLLSRIGKWCLKTYKKADAINVLSNGIKNLLIERGVIAEKISTIPVWCNEELLTGTRDENFYVEQECNKHFTLIYAGAVGAAQGLDIALDGAKELRESIPSLQILIIGTGTCADVLSKRVKEKNIDNVKILPPVPPEKVVPILNCADALFVNLKKDELFSITVPSKIPLYMATGKVIIAGIEGDAAEIINNADCGVTFEPGNVEEFCSAVRKVYNMTDNERNIFAKNGLNYYKKFLSMDSGVDAFNNLFLSLNSNGTESFVNE